MCAFVALCYKTCVTKCFSCEHFLSGYYDVCVVWHPVHVCNLSVQEHGERGPVREIVKVAFKGPKLTEVGQLKFINVRLWNLFSRMTSWVKSGYDAVVDALKPLSGSVIFPFQVSQCMCSCT